MEKVKRSRGRPQRGLYQRGRIWWYDITIDGQRVQKSTSTDSKEEAYEIYCQERAKAQKDGVIRIRKAPLLRKFAEEYMKWVEGERKNRGDINTTASTRRWNRDQTSLNKILPVLGGQRLNKISQFDVEKYKMKRREQLLSLPKNQEQRHEDVSLASINRELALLKRMFNVAIKWKRAADNPVVGVKFYKEYKNTRTLTAEEEENLLSECAGPLKDVVQFLLHTGLRRGEIVTLTWEDINLQSRFFTVQAAYAKSGKSRAVPLNDTAMEILKRLKESDATGPVFLCRTGEPYSYDGVRASFQRAAKRAGLYSKNRKLNVTSHVLRHTFATRLVNDHGISLAVAKEILGHSDIKTTERYVQTSEGHQLDAVRNLDKIRSTGQYVKPSPRYNSVTVGHFGNGVVS